MKQSIRLTESELINVIKRIIKESNGKNLMEQVDPNKQKDDYIQKIITDIVNYANTVINDVKSKFPKITISPITIERIPKPDVNTVIYKIKWGVDYLSWNGDDLALNIMAEPKTLINAISAYFDGTNTTQGYGKHVKKYGSQAIQALSVIRPKVTEMMTKYFQTKPALPTPVKKQQP